MPKKKPAKGERLFQNLQRVTYQFMLGRGFTPLTEKQLRDRLDIPPQHGELFQEVLQALVKEGKARFSQGKYSCQTDEDVVEGMLRLHPRGFGFVQPDDKGLFSKDIFIPRHLTGNGVDGDRVEVLVNNEAVSEKGPEGRITAILERTRTHVAGIIREIDRAGTALAYVPLLGEAQRVVVETPQDCTLQVGDRVVMEVVDWGEKGAETVCQLSHVMGHVSDPSCDVPAAVEEYELRSAFPRHVIEEAVAVAKKITPAEIKKREDLRELECLTIDPDTARDFDDALSLTKDKRGHYHLGVHIADVSHYVRPGSHLDEEAHKRANSVYFPGTCLPMLPEELSNDICSLKPRVNRLTLSVLMEFDERGSLVTHRMVRSVIRSRKRFTYGEAKQVIDGEKSSPYADKLHLMVELCYLLKKHRYERGSIEFAIPEVVIKVDEEGAPTEAVYVTYDITHQLVEEFMLKANELVAFHLDQKRLGLPYRVHEAPSTENMKDFANLANAFGYALPEAPTERQLQEFFDEVIGTPYGQFLAVSYIRRMRLAMYSPNNIGHYGLSLTHYCHFTSPIRRYIDLVIHRILMEEPVPLDKLETVAHVCSERERISARAEISVTLLKKLRLLQAESRENPNQTYEAVITQVKHFGIFFELVGFLLEGFIHISEIGSDYYEYEEKKQRLIGSRSRVAYSIGERVTVMLRDIDLIMLESRWELLNDEGPSERPRNRRRKKR